ncbi:motility associated factor glycosyltransferase family protein [Paenibacillus tarimensis]|uniref:motility associated factor glycosyltransferase family protein n=2 Tax=Paenibacillus tarimensis TaxID=416012 RepID=UPI0039EFA559
MMKRTETEFTATLDEVRRFLPNLIQACNDVEQLFYEPMTDQSWQYFGEVVQAMDDLYKTLNVLAADISELNIYKALDSSIVQAVSELSEKFQALNECVDVEDHIGASDTIRYELIPLFEQLANELGEEQAVLDQRFQANMKVLQARFPQACEEINGLEMDHGRYQLIYSRNGQPNLCNTDNTEEDLCIYSRYNPAEEAARWIRQIADKVEEKTDIIMYGLGLGYHAEAYAKAYPEHRLTIYEPDEQIFLAAMRVVDLEILLKQLNVVDIVVGSKKSLRDKMFYKFLKFFKGDPQFIVLPYYYRLNKIDTEQFSKDAQIAMLDYIGSLQIYKHFGDEWIENSLNNMAATLSCPSVKGLKDRFTGMTAVVAGAGPSLAADIEILRELKDHAFIIAAGSTIQSLLHYGVEPHLIVSMDGGEPNYEAFKGLNIQHIPLLYTPTIKYRIIDEQGDNLLHVHFTNDNVTRNVMDLTPDDPIFSPSHSVTGTAIQAAIYMGCKKIIFTGQDLSYPGENLYSPGARHLSADHNDRIIKGAVQTVENVQGTMNRTNDGMRTTLADIEDMLAEYPEIAFVNTSSLGAKIKHTIFKPMREVLEEVKGDTIEPDFFIKEMKILNTYEEQRKKDVAYRMLRLPDNIRRCQERLKSIDQYIDKVFGLSRTNQKKCFQMFEEIEKEWKLVIDDIAFQGLYNMLFRNELNDFERDLPELTYEQNLINKAKLAQTIMQPLVKEMIARTPSLLVKAEEGARRIKERMPELAG